MCKHNSYRLPRLKTEMNFWIKRKIFLWNMCPNKTTLRKVNKTLLDYNGTRCIRLILKCKSYFFKGQVYKHELFLYSFQEEGMDVLPLQVVHLIGSETDLEATSRGRGSTGEIILLCYKSYVQTCTRKKRRGSWLVNPRDFVNPHGTLFLWKKKLWGRKSRDVTVLLNWNAAFETRTCGFCRKFESEIWILYSFSLCNGS